MGWNELRGRAHELADFLAEAAAEVEELFTFLQAGENFGVLSGVHDAEVEEAVHGDAGIGVL